MDTLDKNTFSRPISLHDIQVTDSFWKKEMELVRTEVITYQWEALNDRVEGAAPSYCMRNFRIAGRMNQEKHEKGAAYKAPVYVNRGFEALPDDKDHLEDKFYGFVFQDSDFSKWIEAVGYSLTQHPDPELMKIADEAIETVCAAQQENGYLDTYYIINGQDKVFSDLKDHHELYCFGHLTEGAVAYYQATGKTELLNAVRRFADFIVERFGEEEGKCKGYPGHEIAEMALVRLYEVTGEDKYLRLAGFFINERGKKPFYFDGEHPDIKNKDNDLRYAYYQAHLPVREQDEAVGHAVRAAYLYSGMADIARLTGDKELYSACSKLWDNITEKKMYITGGIGSTHIGEAFSFNYDLPNDTAYNETCASIGLVFFARRMLEIKPDSRYANVMERALYNGILSGMDIDGKSFFYVNPLEVKPEACKLDDRKHHVKPVRQKWFGCACCPPNLARLISSVGMYGFTENENTLYIHLYMGADLRLKRGADNIRINIKSGFPWNGKVEIEVQAGGTDQMLALRIPDWSDGYKLDDQNSYSLHEKDGYLYISKIWGQCDTIQIEFPMRPRLIGANANVNEDIGKAALTYGPVVYCLEEIDNGRNLHLLSVKQDTDFRFINDSIKGMDVMKIKADGRRMAVDDTEKGLYSMLRTSRLLDVELTYIPYFAWANRGENEMQVWTRVLY